MGTVAKNRSVHGPLAIALALALSLASVTIAHARGPIRGIVPVDCEAARCAVEAAVQEACPCDGADSHRAYTECVASVTRKLAQRGVLPRECRTTVLRCERLSTCGTPDLAACWFSFPKGPARCRLRSSADRCEVAGGEATRGSCCTPCVPASTTTTSTSTTSTTIEVSTTTTTTRPERKTTTTSTVTTTTSTVTLESSSSVTVTTTSSTTSTTPRIPCGAIVSAYPVCLGSCPTDMVCTGDTLLGGCYCVPPATDDSSGNSGSGSSGQN